jgi:uncharacterized membrane protein
MLTAPRSTIPSVGLSARALLASIPVVCFVATLITDVVYWQTMAMLWADMSDWLLLAGLVVSVVAVPVGIIDFFGDPRIRQLRGAWIVGIGNATALILAIFDALIHTRDAYTSVIPSGLTLSALVVFILLVTGWIGRTLVYRDGVGVRRTEGL